jgi:hypothetical protein
MRDSFFQTRWTAFNRPGPTSPLVRILFGGKMSFVGRAMLMGKEDGRL